MIVSLALGAALALGAMALVWLASVRLRNAGIVDVAWSAMFALLAAVYAAIGDGDPARRATGAAMMILWSLRLASHLGIRIFGHLDIEDGRYAALRTSWGAKADRKMLLFFLFQGSTNVVLSLPLLLVSWNGAPFPNTVEMIAIALWLVALVGESAADAQLRRFKADPANRGRVCETGLWRHSRHPNYFFEWLVWCAFFLFALGSPWGWSTAYCPLLMLWFLYRVTGIPATEEQSLRNRGEAYRRYQQTTSAFVPWFRKELE